MNSFTDFVNENTELLRQEELILEATELLAREMNLQGVSKADIARKLGKSKAFVTQCLNGKQNLTLRTLADIFGALNLRMLIGAEPTASNIRVSHRLYPIGAWSMEQRCFDVSSTIDCAAVAETEELPEPVYEEAA